MNAIYGELDRKIFTGVAVNDIIISIVNHKLMAKNINNRKIDAISELYYSRKENIPISPTLEFSNGLKSCYTCILIQGKTHTLFSYEFFVYTDYNKNFHKFSRFIPPNESDVHAFLNDIIIY